VNWLGLGAALLIGGALIWLLISPAVGYFLAAVGAIILVVLLIAELVAAASRR
jgi:hypothetical protein